MRRLFCLTTVLLLAACAPADGPPASGPPEQTAPDERPAPPPQDDADVLTILYLGDSLTAGYGLQRGPEQAYPALIQQRLDSLGITARTINAGVSGDTSSGGRTRLGWYLDRYDVDILVVALGANDGLRGLPVSTLRTNLEALIDAARAAEPGVRILLAGMMVPPSYGDVYFQEFARLYPEIAEAKDVHLVPFLLEGVGGVPQMNQPDGVHPTAAGQRQMADVVWTHLRPVVEDLHAER